jgi:hypothetical protein
MVHALHSRIMRITALLRYPKVTGTTLAFISLAAGATALEAADFGASGWLVAPLLAWLATVGVPSTVAVLLIAALWGTTAPFYGFWLFCIVAAIAAVVSQVYTIKALTYFAGRSV